jgi:hypothetical protein
MPEFGISVIPYDTLVFWPVDPSPEQVELFADEVVPLISDQEGHR